MKTKEDLRREQPAILKRLSQLVLNIGDNSTGYKKNVFLYEENGWTIEIAFECKGERHEEHDTNTEYVTNVDVFVTGITASHYDYDKDEYTEFGSESVDELWDAIENDLKSYII